MDVTIASLWLPTLLGALAVFLSSFVMRMVLKHHWSDFEALPGEESIRAAFHQAGVEGGRQYSLPYCKDMETMQSEAYQAIYQEGPTGVLYIFPKGPYAFGKKLTQSFLFNLFGAFVVAYLASNFLVAGAPAMDVLQFCGTIGFLTFGGAYVWGPIWMGHSWSVCAKELLDALVYGLALGGVFVAFWPAAAAAAG